MKGGHVQVECKDPDCGGTCHACCLAWCAVCGGAEASLPTECPGRRMTPATQEQVVQGIIDYWDGDWRWKTGAKEAR